MEQLHVICDLQFGSTGKGLFAGFLAGRLKPDTLIAAWGPNAGHTFIGLDGVKHVNIMLPNGIVEPSVEQVLIGPGSVIDPGRMIEEIERYAIADGTVKLMIHEHAAVVSGVHREAEQQYGFGIGSTMKGVGEAVIDKIRRRVDGKAVAKAALRGTPLEGYLVSVAEYNDALDASKVAILEGAQGFSLSINQGMYPYTTSRDCTTHQLLSDCGIPRTRWGKGRAESSHAATYGMHVYGVARTYPIRVSNRFEECRVCGGTGDGMKHPMEGTLPCYLCEGRGKLLIGTSGPGYSDQQEIAWADIGREAELTTVTQLPRRIFTFSAEQIQQAIRMNGVDSVFLNFANYAGAGDSLSHIIRQIEQCGPPVAWLGWGPTIKDIEVVADSEFHRA